MPIKNFREKLTRISIVMLPCKILKLYFSFLIYKLEAYKNGIYLKLYCDS